MNSAIFFVPPLCALFDKNVFVFSVDVWIWKLHYIHSIYLHIYFYGIIGRHSTELHKIYMVLGIYCFKYLFFYSPLLSKADALIGYLMKLMGKFRVLV